MGVTRFVERRSILCSAELAALCLCLRESAAQAIIFGQRERAALRAVRLTDGVDECVEVALEQRRLAQRVELWEDLEGPPFGQILSRERALGGLHRGDCGEFHARTIAGGLEEDDGGGGVIVDDVMPGQCWEQRRDPIAL